MPKRHAYSLLELVMATALIGGTLVPAMELVRDGMDLSVECDRYQLLASYAASEVERRLAAVAHNWSSGTTSGDFAADGLADVRYTTVCSDAAIDGGVTDLLMSISATAYYDADGDDSLDADELSCTYATKLGRFASYESL